MPAASSRPLREDIILLHGILKTPFELLPAALYLRSKGYSVHLLGYRTSQGHIHEIAEKIWHDMKSKHLDNPELRLHFVAHSMGGLVVHDIIKNHVPEKLGRVVLWGTPLQGCEYADRLNESGFWGPIYRWLWGRAGQDLQVKTADPERDRVISYEAGVIAGSASINPMAHWFLKGSGAHDGIVPVARTKRTGLADHLILPLSHTGLLVSPIVFRQTVHFLRTGRFLHPV
ncbi:MAG: hypothetical protein EBQ96_08125 [Proteobacteria bacterium]|nr:hypothetical protein [Pseudomonadota bacterium]